MRHQINSFILLCVVAVANEAACPPDSTLVSEERRIEAIDCHERTGNDRKATELIRTLPPSPARDTLYLRHLLLSDSLASARLFADTTTQLRRARDVHLLWRIRIALFSGKTDECSALLDSAAARASRSPTSELMEYRYWLLRFADTPEALAKFVQIEYTLYKGEREAAAKSICTAGAGGESTWRIAVRIARRQIDNSEHGAALSTLQCAPADKEPEYLYLLALSNAGSGATAKARALLERLILEFSGNVYAVKGRLLLSRLPKAAP